MMLCSFCSKPVKLAFKLAEDKTGKNAFEKLACFPCLSTIGREEMSAHDATQVPPATKPPKQP